MKLYASVCFHPYFLSFCPGRKLGIPSNSTDKREPVNSTEREKSPQIFHELGEQRSEPLLWVKNPFVCLP